MCSIMSFDINDKISLGSSICRMVHITFLCLFRFKDGKELKTEDRLTVETDSEVLVSSSITIKHFSESDVGKVSAT
jgi:hypothetical protein